MYRGDIAAGGVIRFKFTTVDRATPGAPVAMAGSPALIVYKGNSTSGSTAGVTLTAGFASVTGLHHVQIDTSADGTFYSSGADFQVVVSAGTIDGVSAVGYVVGEFSIENRTAAMSANAVADALLDRADAIETGWTLRKTIRVIAAAVAGKVSGAGSNAPVFRNLSDTKARVSATTDSNGNRLSVTLDGN